MEQTVGSAESDLPVAGPVAQCLLLQQHLFKLAPLVVVTTTFSWQANWGLAISRQEAGHSGLKTDLHSVRNRAPLCCGGHPLLGWLRRGPTDSLSHSDVPTQGCQEVWLFWGQVSSVHPWISSSTPHSKHCAPNSESPQPCGPTRLFSGHRPVRGISGS